MPTKEQRRLASVRWRDVMVHRSNGKTYREIGEIYGVSGERARQLYKRGVREKAYRENKGIV